MFLAYPLFRLELTVMMQYFIHFLRISQYSGERIILVATGRRGRAASLLDIKRTLVMGLFGFLPLKMEAAPGADFNPVFPAILAGSAIK